MFIKLLQVTRCSQANLVNSLLIIKLTHSTTSCTTHITSRTTVTLIWSKDRGVVQPQWSFKQVETTPYKI